MLDWLVQERLTIAAAGVLVGIVLVGVDSLRELRRALLDDRRAQLQVLVEAAAGVIARSHELQLHGALGEAEARRQAAESLRSMSGEGGRFFIIDHFQHFVLHAARPALEGQNGAQMRDRDGRAVVSEVVRLGMSGRGGLVESAWAGPASEAPLPRLACIGAFPPWGWIYGSSLELGEVERLFRREALRTVALIALACLLLGVAAVGVGLGMTRLLVAAPAPPPVVALVGG